MKKIVIALFVIMPALVFAQDKAIKPNMSKAEKSLREGKIDEAKTMIDVCVGSQEFMVDKKGQPSKNAAKAWYMKGLIYFAIDTTTKEQFKSLEANPFPRITEALDKCKEIDGGKSAYFITESNGLPVLVENIASVMAIFYYNKAITAYNDKKDNKAPLEYAEKTLYFIPKDTTVLLFTGGVFAIMAGDFDKGLLYLDLYNKAGGNSPEAFTGMANIYIDNKKDNVSALRVLSEGKAKYPKYKDLRLLELNIYLGEKKYEIARQMIERELEADPTNKDNFFLYGQLNRELGEAEKAKEAFKKVLEIDPKNFDAAGELANLYWADAKVFKDEMGKLGNSKTDLEKLKKLDVHYVEKLKIYIPYIEACEKLSPDDVTVLYSLLNVYEALGDDPKMARVKKRLKALGEEVN